MGLRSYIIKRTIYSLLLVLFVIVLNFVIFELMPGSPLESFMDPRLRPEQIQDIIVKFGLDQPLHIKFIKYVQNMLTLEFGFSYRTLEPVSSEILMRLGNTLLLMGTVEVVSIVLGLILGVVAAYRRGGFLTPLPSSVR